ncbi:MAG: outer membrane beta-barrel protein [Novosphingobium sp.]
MFFRKASFIFAAGIAHPALAQATLPQIEGSSGERSAQGLRYRYAESAGWQTEMRNFGPLDERSSMRVSGAAGRAPPSAVGPVTLNTDGPYFLDDVAGNRIQHGYEPFRHRIGAFLVSPSITTRVRSDDNWTARGQSLPLVNVIASAAGSLEGQFGFALPGGASAEILAQTINPHLADVGDLALEFAPALTVASDWSRHSFSLEASARVTRFGAVRRLNRDEFQIGTRSRLDIGGGAATSVRISYLRQAEPNGTNGLAVLDFFGFGPSLVNRLAAGVNIGFKFSRASVVLDAGYNRDRYRPLDLDLADLIRPDQLPTSGLPASIELSQDYRNRSQAVLSLRLNYNLGPDLDVFLVPSFSRVRQSVRISDEDFAVGIPGFSSNTVGVVTGIRKNFSRLIVVQGGIRFQRRTYDNPALIATRRMDIEGAVDWYPTPLVSVRVNAAQQFRGSGILGQADIVTRTVGARADYEVLRNLGLRFDGSVAWDRYPAVGNQSQAIGQTARLDAAVQLIWTIGRSTEVTFSAGGHRRRANNSIFLGSFTASRFGISLTRRI